LRVGRTDGHHPSRRASEHVLDEPATDALLFSRQAHSAEPACKRLERCLSLMGILAEEVLREPLQDERPALASWSICGISEDF